jgi:hypothetical protein
MKDKNYMIISVDAGKAVKMNSLTYEHSTK